MRAHFCLIGALVLAAATLAAGEPAAPASRVMAGWFNVATPEGWVGRRYMDGQDIFAEEFDSNGDGRIDVWRFYRRGLLSSEERDTNANGRVDFQSKWEAREGRLVSVLRDTNHRGVNDLEIESTGPRRWEIREDRNHDGVSDRILFIDAPPDFFEALGVDLATQPNIIDCIPREYWRELWTDDGYSCSITAYYRYSRGVVSHYGEWDGQRVAWRRVGADFQAPPAPQPVAPGDPFAGDPYGGDPLAGGDGAFCRVEDSDAPITDVMTDPFAAPPAEGGTAQYLDGSDPFATGTYFPPASGGTAPLRDRTRYEGLPPGESAARSVPARMRPPGTSRR